MAKPSPNRYHPLPDKDDEDPPHSISPNTNSHQTKALLFNKNDIPDGDSRVFDFLVFTGDLAAFVTKVQQSMDQMPQSTTTSSSSSNKRTLQAAHDFDNKIAICKSLVDDLQLALRRSLECIFMVIQDIRDTSERALHTRGDSTVFPTVIKNLDESVTWLHHPEGSYLPKIDALIKRIEKLNKSSSAEITAFSKNMPSLSYEEFKAHTDEDSEEYAFSTGLKWFWYFVCSSLNFSTKVGQELDQRFQKMISTLEELAQRVKSYAACKKNHENDVASPNSQVFVSTASRRVKAFGESKSIEDLRLLTKAIIQLEYKIHSNWKLLQLPPNDSLPKLDWKFTAKSEAEIAIANAVSGLTPEEQQAFLAKLMSVQQ